MTKTKTKYQASRKATAQAIPLPTLEPTRKRKLELDAAPKPAQPPEQQQQPNSRPKEFLVLLLLALKTWGWTPNDYSHACMARLSHGNFTVAEIRVAMDRYGVVADEVRARVGGVKGVGDGDGNRDEDEGDDDDDDEDDDEDKDDDEDEDDDEDRDQEGNGGEDEMSDEGESVDENGSDSSDESTDNDGEETDSEDEDDSETTGESQEEDDDEEEKKGDEQVRPGPTTRSNKGGIKSLAQIPAPKPQRGIRTPKPMNEKDGDETGAPQKRAASPKKTPRYSPNNTERKWVMLDKEAEALKHGMRDVMANGAPVGSPSRTRRLANASGVLHLEDVEGDGRGGQVGEFEGPRKKKKKAV